MSLTLLSVDVSVYIALSHFSDTAYSLKEGGRAVWCLITPQFEAGRENVGKKGRCKAINRCISP